MTRTVSIPSLGSEFDDFLFAPVGEERNGMLLSVLSALARLDIDPWQEAANLARLPAKSATRRLTSLIAALPAVSGPRRDLGTNAARLIGLLPHLASTITPQGSPRPWENDVMTNDGTRPETFVSLRSSHGGKRRHEPFG